MKTHTFDCIVVGTGAAGYNAAIRVFEDGKKSVAIVTEGISTGTSRNTGSDKQTYYKLSLSGSDSDSVHKMAGNLFDGGCVDGDNALCEAALSVRCFMNLCELGVAFPVNRYGEYVGYKTDHDPFERATSAGPLTSKFMTEALEKKASKLGVPVFDNILAVRILTDKNGVRGVAAIDKKDGSPVIFNCANVVVATGGPAGIYKDSVFPECHTGSTGLAIEAGAHLQNMTEWQYGLASVSPRWNVSGTYMQVLPRFVSIDKDGTEHEFLKDFFEDEYKALSAVFLKGYQWPFDSKKVLEGSSVIDILVYRECALKDRRVYLDFTKNPFSLGEICYEKLEKEAFDYLDKAGAKFGLPIDRLEKMNPPAIELYKSKGVDITKEYLEIALCAQHNNGGIAVDKWWQTSVEGLFAAGEAAGTHGIARPGGSALNAGQVGSLRAAQYVSANDRFATEDGFDKVASKAAAEIESFAKSMLSGSDNVLDVLEEVRKEMSLCAAAMREREGMERLLEKVYSYIENFENEIAVRDRSFIFMAYKLRDTLLTSAAVLTAMTDYAKTVGQTRGSSLTYDKDGDLRKGLDETFRLRVGSDAARDKVQQVYLSQGRFETLWRPVREIPSEDSFFENVWATYRENKNIY